MKKKILTTALFSSLLLGGIIVNPSELISNNTQTDTNIAYAAPQASYKGYSHNGYATITKNNQTIWSNLRGGRKGTTNSLYNQTLKVKYRYEFSNGQKLYSIYNKNEQWLGYVDGNSIVLSGANQGSAFATQKFVVMNRPNYTLYSNFRWTSRNKSADFINRKLQVKYTYYHFNGSAYYSMYNLNNEWLGYINRDAVRDYIDTGYSDSRVNMYVTVTEKEQPVYSNLSFNRKGVTTSLVNQTFHVKYKYVRNFKTYYSLYNNKGEWQGYVQDNALKTTASKNGVWLSENMYVAPKSNSVKLYTDLNKTKVRGTTDKMSGNAYKVTGKYVNFDGTIMYSLYDVNGAWQGYAQDSDLALKVDIQGQGHTVTPAKQVKIKNNKVTIYKDLDLKDKVSAADYADKKLSTSKYYRHFDGNTYYEIIDESKKIVGYVKEADLSFNLAGLIGVKDLQVYVGDTDFDFKKGVTAKDTNGKTFDVVFDKRDLNLAKAGTYQVQYRFEDDNDQIVYQNVKVEVIASPDFTGLGDKTINISEAKDFDLMSGVKVVDHAGKVMNVTVTGFDATKAGEQTVSYVVEDANGKKFTETRKIIVKDDRDLTFEGINDVRQNISVGTFSPRAGVTVKNGAGNTVDFKVTGSVDPTRVGTYILEYSAKNVDTGKVSTEIRRVTIYKEEVTSINFENAKDVVRVGSETVLIAKITPEDASDKSLTWVSSEPSVATVDNNGKITGITQGTAQIIATARNGVARIKEITVKPEISLTINLTGDATKYVDGKYTEFKMQLTNTTVEGMSVKSIKLDGVALTAPELTQVNFGKLNNGSMVEKSITKSLAPGKEAEVTVVDDFGFESTFKVAMPAAPTE